MTLLVMLLFGGAVGILVHPFYGILPYYIFAALRPQSIWSYALPEGIRWSLIAAAVALAGAILHAPRLIVNLRWNVVATLIAIFAGMVLFSCLAARDSALAADQGVEYAKIFVMALLATVVIQRVAHVRWLMIMIFACISYLAWEFNYRYIFDNELDIYFAGHGGLDNNDTSIMLAMGLPLAYGCWRMQRHWLVTVGAAAVALLIMHAIMLSYSRSGMVAAIVALTWLAWHHRPRRHVLLLVPVVVATVLYMAGPEVRSEFLSINNYEQDTSSQRRMESWERGWETAWDHPWTGVGVRNSNQMSLAYGAHTHGRSVHNMYLHIAADNGILAMGVYVSILITALIMLWRFRHRLDDESPSHHSRRGPPPQQRREWQAMALAIEGSLIAFAVGGVFLSLQFFELPWLLMVMAGALPTVATPRPSGAAVVEAPLDELLADDAASLPGAPRHA